jgi:hypothetical protein
MLQCLKHNDEKFSLFKNIIEYINIMAYANPVFVCLFVGWFHSNI